MDKLTRYAQNQRTQYDTTSGSVEDARSQVAPNYEQVQQIGDSYAKFIFHHYFIRCGQYYDPERCDVSDLRVLDLGCGVGRVMEAFAALGAKVDGCDISEVMLSHARGSPQLADSKFFLTSGVDTGDSPREHYDIACSFLCFHHIPMRQTRISLLKALADNLKPNGMVFVELKVYPGATAAKIPPNHAHWTENMVAQYTNSRSDVWLTPDALGCVYQDVRLFFNDVALFEFELAGSSHYDYNPDAIYQLGFNEMFVAATKSPMLKDRMRTGL